MTDHREDIAGSNENEEKGRISFYDEERENEIGEALLTPSERLKTIGIELDQYSAGTINMEGKNFDRKKIKKMHENGFVLIEDDIYDLVCRNDLSISDEEITFCKKHGLTKYRDVTTTINTLHTLQNINKETINHYLIEKGKQKKTLSDEEFQKLFGGKGKYNKAEINQGGLAVCYLYTSLEMLKKTNYFDTIIQNNLKQTQEGREVRIPFFSGEWIKVYENEIDKRYKVKDQQDKIREFSINSDTSLGFKILEIAFIKEEIKRRARENNIGILEENDETGDNALTGEKILSVEGGYTDKTFQRLLPKCTTSLTLTQDEIDKAFDQFKTGLYTIELGVKENIQGNENIITHIPKHRDGGAIVKDVKILNNKGEEYTKTIEKCPSKWTLKNNKVYDQSVNFNYIVKHGKDKYKREKNPYKHKILPFAYPDFVNNEKREQIAYFFEGHSYSIEKCYTTPSGEKRVQVINPRHTGIKFDISLEEAKNIFDRTCIFINPDKLFPSSEET